jgi:hypothetical protein
MAKDKSVYAGKAKLAGKALLTKVKDMNGTKTTTKKPCGVSKTGWKK